MSQAVLDHLWQSTLFAAAAGLLTLACRRDRADIRFALWFAASLKFLIPFPAIVMIGRALRWHDAPALEIASGWSQALDQVAQPAAALSSAPATSLPMMPPSAGPGPTPWHPASLLWVLWAAGTAILLLRRAWQGWSIARSVRAASPLPIEAPLPVLSAPALPEPGLFGLFRPVLLFPAEIFAQLPPGQLAAILAHELCHWRRRDNLTAALHMLVQALFWFHPMVWWLGARLMVERERACDEAVIRAGGDRQDYAEGILKVCRFHLGRAPLLMAGVSGGDLAARIERIMSAPLAQGLPIARKALLAAAGCLAVLGPVAVGMAFVSPRKIAAQEEVRVEPATLDHYVGYYDMPPFSVLAVSRDGDQLRTSRDGRGHQTLFPDSQRDFAPRSSLAQLTFVVDEGGDATAVIWHENGTDRVYRRIDEKQAAAIDTFRADRLQATAPMPGEEGAIRRYLDYPGQKEPFLRSELASLGRLQSLAFAGTRAGWDVYHAHFAEGDWELRVVPAPDGQLVELEHQSFKPAKKLALEEIGKVTSSHFGMTAEEHHKRITDAMEGKGSFPRGPVPDATLEFVNSGNSGYQLYCIDQKGDFHYFGPLPPHGLSVQKIFDMDKWVIGTDRDHPVALFAASPGLTVATID